MPQIRLITQEVDKSIMKTPNPHSYIVWDAPTAPYGSIEPSTHYQHREHKKAN